MTLPGCDDPSLRDQTLATFRRRHRSRRTLRRTGAALAVVAAAGAGLWFAAFAPNESEERNVDMADVSPSATGRKAPVLAPLTDEELLAAFPEDSCFLATVDNRKVLVFQDAELRARFAR